MPLIRRLPKRGFNNAAFHKQYAVVNLSDLVRFERGSVVNEQSLREAKLIRGRYAGVKILGTGELQHELKIQVSKVSASAREKIEKAGGTISAPEPRRETAGSESESAGSKPAATGTKRASAGTAKRTSKAAKPKAKQSRA